MSSLIRITLLSLTVLVSYCQANIILLDSQAGLANSLSPATVAITAHPAWQANNPVNPVDADDTSAVWISYALSGYGDSGFQPYNGISPVVSIFHDFQSGPGYLDMHVWADDTAEVLLDGISLFSPVFTQNTCSGQPIGCRPQDFGVVHAEFLGGAHQLEFRLFQVGTSGDSASNPFGLLYTGAAVSSFQPNVPTQTPEPATLALTGGVLLALGLAVKLRRRSQ